MAALIRTKKKQSEIYYVGYVELKMDSPQAQYN